MAKSHSFTTGQTPVMKYNRGLMMAILHDRIKIAKAVNVELISLEQAPEGYQSFDAGIPKKFVIDPHHAVLPPPLRTIPAKTRITRRRDEPFLRGPPVMKRASDGSPCDCFARDRDRVAEPPGAYTTPWMHSTVTHFGYRWGDSHPRP